MHVPLMIHLEDNESYTDDYLLSDYGDGAPIQKIPTITGFYIPSRSDSKCH